MPLDMTNSESECTRMLREARDIIAKGYCAGMRSDGNGNHCALGAVDCALGTFVFPSVLDENAKAAKMIGLLAQFATYRGLDRYNYDAVRDDSHPLIKIAGHNNMMGKQATLAMFDSAIAKSVKLDTEACVNA